MSIATMDGSPSTTSDPRPFRWTCDLFHDVCDQGVFEGRNVILMNGEIIEMPPPNPPHNTGLTLTDEVLRAIFRPGYVVRNQMALDLDMDIDPVPDLAIVTGSARDWANSQPTTAVLVVEVSDSTLAYDTTTKAELYATGEIADYWVLDVGGRSLIVFRDPVPLPDGGRAYRSKNAFAPSDSVSPLAMPNASVKVADLLP